MHLAAACGYLQCVKTLLAHGADITLRNAIGQTPLEEAEQTGLDESDVCVEHLRSIWHQLEEEAAARMLSMLEMEEASARSSSSRSQSSAPAVVGSSKKSKKKNKKLKRRAAKQQAPGTGDTGQPPVSTADRSSSAQSLEGSAVAGGGSEPVSSGESSDDDDDVADRDGRDPRVLNDTVGAERESTQSDNVELSSDNSAVAGVWTTVGRKASKPAASASSSTDDVASQSRASPRTEIQHLTGTAYSSGKTRTAKAPSPSQSTQLVTCCSDWHTSELTSHLCVCRVCVARGGSDPAEDTQAATTGG